MSLVKKVLALGVLTGALALGNGLIGADTKQEAKAPKKETVKESVLEKAAKKQNILDKKPAARKKGDYFPLEVGNEWKYETIVPEGKQHFSIKDYLKGRSGIAIQAMESGKYITHFGIVKRTGDGYKLKVEKDDMDIFADGERVYLKSKPHQSDQRLTLIVERPQNGKAFSRRFGTRHLNIKYYECRQTNPIGDHSRPQPLIYCWLPEFGKEYDITVPAGTFKCKKVVERYIPKNMMPNTLAMRQRGEGKTFYEGWNIETFYADGVGLIISRQFENDGTILDTTRLISYKIGGEKEGRENASKK